MQNKKKEFWLIVGAFAVIYLVWGSTYLANWWAVRSIPPFLLAGIRFFVAGSIMYLVSAGFGAPRPTLNQWKNACFSGVMLFVIGNGAVVWALQYVDSGITALLIAFDPLIVVLMQWKMRNIRPGWNQWIGIFIGLVGMTLLIGQPQFISNTQWIFGTIGVMMAIFSWAYISIWIGRADLPSSPFQSASLQMLCGGVILLIISAFLGDYGKFQIENLTDKAFWSLLYLIVFGSILAFSAFNFLLVNVTPDKVATSTYVNPVVALFLGWWLNHENMSPQSLLASALLLLGVFFINSRLGWLRKFGKILSIKKKE